jgi:hypothetical protein
MQEFDSAGRNFKKKDGGRQYTSAQRQECPIVDRAKILEVLENPVAISGEPTCRRRESMPATYDSAGSNKKRWRQAVQISLTPGMPHRR